jgi:hypothetical protein
VHRVCRTSLEETFYRNEAIIENAAKCGNENREKLSESKDECRSRSSEQCDTFSA